MSYRRIRQATPFDPGVASSPTEDFAPKYDGDDYQSIYDRSRAGTLFHYTSNEAFLAIFENRSIRATDLRYLNDTREFAHAVDLFVDVCDNRAKKNTELTAFAKLAASVAAGKQQGVPPVYVFCLSERENDLAQWRAYTPPTGGVMLGFETRRLQMHAERAGFRLVQCVYDQQAQLALAIELFERAHTQYIHLGLPQTRREQEGQFCTQFLYDFLVLAPKLKHPAFAAEREWRLVRHTVKKGINWNSSGVHCRVGATTLVPYVEIPFEIPDSVDEKVLDGSQRALYWPATAVICGPTAHPQLAAFAADIVMQRVAWLQAWPGVGTSEIPYRKNV